MSLRRLFFAAFACLSGSAGAHPVLTEALSVEVTPAAVVVRLRPSVQAIRSAARLPEAPTWSDEEWRSATAGFGPYLLAHLRVAANGRELAGRVVTATAPSRESLTAAKVESTFGLWEVHFPLAEAERDAPVVHLRHRLLVDREYLRGQRWQLTLAVTYRATAEGPWEQRRLPPESTLVLAARLPSPLPPDPFAP